MTNLGHTSSSAIAVVITVLASCATGPPTEDAPRAGGSVSATATALASVTPPARALPAEGSVVIDEAPAKDGTAWLPRYAMQRWAGEQGKTLAQAEALCVAHGRALCTETQWVKACAQVPALGNAETWTRSVSSAGCVVRGGAHGCATSAVAGPTEVTPDRLGVCCEPAVGITTTNTDVSFLRTTSGKVAAYQAALNKRDGASLKQLVSEGASITRPKSREGLFGFYDAYNAKQPDLWIAIDACDVALSADQQSWTAECSSSAQRAGKVAAFRARFVWGGPEGKLLAGC
jgi:hypothetical protein